MDIKDIALKVAAKYGDVLEDSVIFNNDDDPDSTWTFQKFAEALVAEIQRRGEPVAFMSTRNGFICKENKNPEYNTPLFTFPPSIEALEDKVAEACAAYLSNRAKPNLEAAQVMDDSVAAIRSGEWKKFRKGE